MAESEAELVALLEQFAAAPRAEEYGDAHEQVLVAVAKTGTLTVPWSLVQPLVISKVDQIIADYRRNARAAAAHLTVAEQPQPQAIAAPAAHSSLAAAELPAEADADSEGNSTPVESSSASSSSSSSSSSTSQADPSSAAVHMDVAPSPSSSVVSSSPASTQQQEPTPQKSQQQQLQQHRSQHSQQPQQQTYEIDETMVASSRELILSYLSQFTTAPFTLQRLCEVLTEPRKYYRNLHKLLRALEKNVAILNQADEAYPALSHHASLSLSHSLSSHSPQQASLALDRTLTEETLPLSSLSSFSSSSPPSSSSSHLQSPSLKRRASEVIEMEEEGASDKEAATEKEEAVLDEEEEEGRRGGQARAAPPKSPRIEGEERDVEMGGAVGDGGDKGQ